MKPYAFHPEAAEEYAQAAQYYAGIVREPGTRFYAEIERCILEARRQPTRFFSFSPPARRGLAHTQKKMKRALVGPSPVTLPLTQRKKMVFALKLRRAGPPTKPTSRNLTQKNAKVRTEFVTKTLLTRQCFKTYVSYIRLKTSVRPKVEVSSFETRQRIIESAEKLFAVRGIEGVSIRDITQAARVNLAAINYHFGTKSALAAEVFKHCIDPLNVRRLQLLDDVEKTAGKKAPKLEAVLEAMIRPAVERGFDQDQDNETFLRLTGRCLSEPNAEIETLVRAHFEKLIRRFDAAFLRALPGLEPAELFWRIKFMVGALHYSLLTCGKQKYLPVKMRKALDAEGLIQRLVTFTAAGLRASI